MTDNPMYFMYMFIESTFATLPRTTRGISIVLGGDPKGKNFLYTNGNSVVIRDIAVRALYQLISAIFWWCASFVQFALDVLIGC